MGILPCSREGCENVMCDRLSSVGYICHECFDELVELGVPDIDDMETQYLEKFLDSPKGSKAFNEVDALAFWDKIIPFR